jgi:hypothetical protein
MLGTSLSSKRAPKNALTNLTDLLNEALLQSGHCCPAASAPQLRKIFTDAKILVGQGGFIGFLVLY